MQRTLLLLLLPFARPPSNSKRATQEAGQEKPNTKASTLPEVISLRVGLKTRMLKMYFITHCASHLGVSSKPTRGARQTDTAASSSCVVARVCVWLGVSLARCGQQRRTHAAAWSLGSWLQLLVKTIRKRETACRSSCARGRHGGSAGGDHTLAPGILRNRDVACAKRCVRHNVCVRNADVRSGEGCGGGGGDERTVAFDVSTMIKGHSVHWQQRRAYSDAIHTHAHWLKVQNGMERAGVIVLQRGTDC